MKIKKVFLLVLGLLLISLPVLAEEENVVATVGGEEVTAVQLEQVANTQQLIMQLSQTNQEFAQLLYSTDAGQRLLDEYKKQKLDELIDETLLKLEADKKGITLTENEEEEAFNNYLQQIKDQNDLTDEEIVSILSQQGIESLEEYKEMFLSNSNLRINKLLKQELFDQITVSDQEAEEVYNNNKEQFKNSEGTAPFEEVKEQIVNTIKQQKQQQALGNYIDELRETVEIEKYL